MGNGLLKLSEAPRILVRGVNWVGDAVMSTPALQRLRQRFPAGHITLLSHEKLAELWRNHPSLNEVLTFEPGESPWAIGRRLRTHQFESALLLPNSPRAAFEAWFAGIPERIGYARPWRNWLLTRPNPARPGHRDMHKRSAAEVKRLVSAASPPPRAAATEDLSGVHHALDYLHLAAALGAEATPIAPLLAVSPEETQATAAKFNLRPEPAKPLFALNPGAEYGPAKRWPAQNFIAAAREVHEQTRCLWVIVGGPADVQLAREIQVALADAAPGSARSLAGQTSLGELMAVLKTSRVLLTNDSGPMHVAAALGTPVIVPFGSTSPAFTAPGLPGEPRHQLLTSAVPCSPCFRRTCPIDFRCMSSISVEAVVRAVLKQRLPAPRLPRPT